MQHCNNLTHISISTIYLLLYISIKKHPLRSPHTVSLISLLVQPLNKQRKLLQWKVSLLVFFSRKKNNLFFIYFGRIACFHSDCLFFVPRVIFYGSPAVLLSLFYFVMRVYISIINCTHYIHTQYKILLGVDDDSLLWNAQ